MVSVPRRDPVEGRDADGSGSTHGSLPLYHLLVRTWVVFYLPSIKDTLDINVLFVQILCCSNLNSVTLVFILIYFAHEMALFAELVGFIMD